jgi:hypothetical protein
MPSIEGCLATAPVTDCECVWVAVALLDAVTVIGVGRSMQRGGALVIAVWHLAGVRCMHSVPQV